MTEARFRQQATETAAGVPYLRTPDSNFADLPDFAYEPRYLTYEGLRVHYVDAGPRNGPVALLTQGMPTWSFLNRKLIRRLTDAGWRCIAPDHIGFGRSDKVVDPDWYSITRHVDVHRHLVQTLDLRDYCLFCQDWGGPIGLSQAAEAPERVARLVIMNTWLHHDDYRYTEALRNWNAQWKPGGFFDRNLPDPLSVGLLMLMATQRLPRESIMALVTGGVQPQIDAATDAIRRGYDAPFAGLDARALAGARRFPLSLPFDNPVGGAAAAQAEWFASLQTWTKPIHFIWGGADDVFTEEWGRSWANHYPQATFDFLAGAGHFLQDTRGDEIADVFLRRCAGS